MRLFHCRGMELIHFLCRCACWRCILQIYPNIFGIWSFSSVYLHEIFQTLNFYHCFRKTTPFFAAFIFSECFRFSWIFGCFPEISHLWIHQSSHVFLPTIFVGNSRGTTNWFEINSISFSFSFGLFVISKCN